MIIRLVYYCNHSQMSIIPPGPLSVQLVKNYCACYCSEAGTVTKLWGTVYVKIKGILWFINT